jgi:hypothetical protein
VIFSNEFNVIKNYLRAKLYMSCGNMHVDSEICKSSNFLPCGVSALIDDSGHFLNKDPPHVDISVFDCG